MLVAHVKKECKPDNHSAAPRKFLISRPAKLGPDPFSGFPGDTRQFVFVPLAAFAGGGGGLLPMSFKKAVVRTGSCAS